MRRTEPPTFATWMLEHLVPGAPDPAFSRRLANEFYSGRSDAWYWQEVFSRCAAAWIDWLRSHAILLGFAFFWSVMVPSWTAVLDKAEDNAQVLGRTWHMDWPFSSPAAFGIWLASSFLFLWIGLLLYLVVQTGLRWNSNLKAILRSFMLRVLLFFPSYFGTFVILNLWSYPGPEVDRSTISALGGLVDVRFWANAIRIPYFLTLVWAMWKVAPVAASVSSDPGVGISNSSSELSRSFLSDETDLSTVKRGLTLMTGAGLMNAMIAGFLFCRLPEAYSPTISSLLFRATIYVTLGAVAGIGGTWIYWSSPSSPFKSRPPVPFPVFSLICAAGWIWVPAMVIFYDQVSRAAAIVAMIGAFALGAGMRRVTLPLLSLHPSTVNTQPEQFDLFSEALYRPPVDPSGFVIAIGIFAGAYAFIQNSVVPAAWLLAFTSFLFAWKKTHVRGQRILYEREPRHATLRLLCAALPAVLITTWALLDGIAYRNRVAELAAPPTAGSGKTSDDSKNSNSRFGIDGYESIILYPLPRKKQIIPPIRARSSSFGPNSSQPLVIRFDGAYWYFQPPDKQPGPNAHEAHGSPAVMAIKSENSIPLAVEAHQHLGSEIKLSECRELQVEIEDHDRDPGEVTMVVLLSDSTSPKKPAASLGGQIVVSNDLGHPNFRLSPSFKTLRFRIPSHASIRKFDEITVELIPDVEHAQVGPKLAIEQFQLFPR